MMVLSLFIIGHMGLFFYTEKGSIISTVDLPTTDIIEPRKPPAMLVAQTEDKLALKLVCLFVCCVIFEKSSLKE